MIGRLHTVVIDCPEPATLAAFYSELLGMPITREDDDWVEITDSDGRRLAFQQALDLRAPHWPDPERPQQFHLDVMVDEIEDAEKRVLELGAVRLPGEGDDFRVYADPVGHPFCLVWE